MEYLDDLNDVQRQAVTTTDGPVMVIAGPGSGKTRVLTYRISHLIESGVYPEQILALTFTNKAAREMKERIAKVVGDRARRLWAGTFHSIFARILRVEAGHIGYPSNFTIYDTADSRSLLTRIIKEMNLDKNNYNVNSVRARISSAKSNLITPRLYAQDQDLLGADRFNNRPMLYAIYNKYVSQCKQAGAMDFDDLLYRLYELLQKNPEGVLEKYRQRFAYILVDEFQDTNYLQYAILKKLVYYEESPQNICVVGDDAQSIYAFRGATIDNILNFKKEFPTLKTFKLEQNYRSTHCIVEAANQVILRNKKQIQKKIWTDKIDATKIKLVKTVSDNEEGRRVADMIVEHKNRYHVPNKEIAILYRTNAQSRVFEEQLRRYNISYKVFGGLSFYQRKEIKDLIAYLRLSINPYDEEALMRVINYPKRGIGNSTLDTLTQYAAEKEITVWRSLLECPLPKKAKSTLSAFAKLIDGFARKAVELNAFEAATHIAARSGVVDALRGDNSIEGMSRLENITALLDGIKEFCENDEALADTELENDRSLASYLQNIALVTDLDETSEDRDFVTLMSVHSAKGLEFDSIFVAGMEENIFPSVQALDEKDGIDEERRLFYVAITRARKYLTLSFAGSRYRFGKIVYNQPSRFIEEISEELMDSAIPRKPMAQPVRLRAAVKGNFNQKSATGTRPVTEMPSDFLAAAPHEIAAGMRVRHLRFGEGKVLSIDGYNDAKVATIFFQGIANPQRRIMLKFAKLHIVDS
ncbi:MAG: UvrD-helicase domain-containing protein [Saprospiraceae bacterium]|nr:UvrD-helicase domain-containing protein [Saprospiraceae bacterium]